MGRLNATRERNSRVGQNNAEPIVTACNNCDIWKQLCEYKDLEKAGRLYIMSEKLASHVKDVIGKAEYEAKIKAETNHGVWMQDLDDVICSECETYWNVYDDCTETFKYCPNCGAKMKFAERKTE